MDYTIDKEKTFVFEVGSLYDRLCSLLDLRQRRGIRYPLPIALTMIMLAKLAGEDEPHGIAVWLSHRREQLCRCLAFQRQTTPHASTVGRILDGAIEQEAFDRLVGSFLSDIQSRPWQEAAEEAAWSVVSMDGKTLRGTIRKGETQGSHLLAAYLPAEGVVLMQVEVDEKENEISAAPRLLALIDVQGKVVTGDALHTQRDFSMQIVDAGGDYLFIVKDNQANTRQAIEALFTEPAMRVGFHAVATDFQTATTSNKGHGRLETRHLTSSSMLNDYLDWPHLGQVFRIERRVVDLTTGRVSQEVGYGLTSLTADRAAPLDLLTINRTCWGIENGLHYRRDVTFGEDASRVRSRDGQHLMATLNNLVLGLILRHKGEPTVPDERRRYCAQPQAALRLLTCVT